MGRGGEGRGGEGREGGVETTAITGCADTTSLLCEKGVVSLLTQRSSSNGTFLPLLCLQRSQLPRHHQLGEGGKERRGGGERRGDGGGGKYGEGVQED